MATLLFTPCTTIDANIFQFRLDNSPFHAEWNVWTGAYEFQEEEEYQEAYVAYFLHEFSKW